MKLISSRRADRIRSHVARYPQLSSLYVSECEYGHVERVQGTGRATCRCCGQKIDKGVPALKWTEDMGGCGSYTAMAIQVHEQECKP